MLDLVFVVDDPTEWHAENLQQNWRQTSSLSRTDSPVCTGPLKPTQQRTIPQLKKVKHH